MSETSTSIERSENSRAHRALKDIARPGIFTKIFLYTLMILALVVGGIFLFFMDQIKTTIAITQEQQVKEVLQPFIMELDGMSEQKIILSLEEFHKENPYYGFRIESLFGYTLYETDNFESQETLFAQLTMSDKILSIAGPSLENSVSSEVTKNALFALIAVLLISLIAAAVFARLIAKPIQKIANDVHQMTKLEPVDTPKERRDEIGALAKDVYDMYQELLKGIDRLEEEITRVKNMQDSQRYFFSAASHELKTPIAASEAILEGIIEGVIEPEQQEQYLQECMKLMQEQSKRVSEILEIVKLEGEMVSVHLEPTSLVSLIEGVLERFSPIIEAKGQSIEFIHAEDVCCDTDDGLLNKALSNIILNAVQNSPESAAIRIRLEKESITIWNGGVQIDEEQLDKLFEPFFRSDESRSNAQGKSGLGLVIVAKSLDLIGAKYSIANEYGGVSFKISLPIS